MQEAAPEAITTYQYDLQGSLTKEQSADFCKQYLYNDFHQCIQTDVIRGREADAERLVQQNLYDGEGLRFALIENGNRTGFITDGWDNVTELDGNGRVRKRIIRGIGIVASEDTEESADTANVFTASYHYYHGNERMDVEYITDESGNVVNSYTYDAFGGIISSNETIPNRYTYNGEAYDKTTEQYCLRKRYYNPKLCRFTQEDEYRGDGLNLYAFCANNPVMYVDPSGYSFLDNLLFDSQDDIDSRVKQTPSEKATYGQWSDKRGDSRFYFNNTDHTPLHNRVEAIMAKHNATYVPYKNGQVDFDYFAVFTVDVVIDPKRSVTHPRTNEEIARIIVEYNGDYNRMYADNVMGIASGSQHSQNVAKEIIGEVSDVARSQLSNQAKIADIADSLKTFQAEYNQTIHEENLVLGKKQNKTQWVDTDINKQFGHLGGTAETKKMLNMTGKLIGFLCIANRSIVKKVYYCELNK